MGGARIGEGEGFNQAWITFRSHKGKKVDLTEQLRIELAQAVNNIVKEGHLISKVKPRPGDEYEVTEKGIYLTSGGQRVNVFDDLGVKGRARKDLRLAVGVVARRAIGQADISGTIVIKVPTQMMQDFSKTLEHQQKFRDQLASILNEWAIHAAVFQKTGLNDKAIAELKLKYEKLQKKVDPLTAQMEGCRALLIDSEISEALKLFSTALRDYTVFCQLIEDVGAALKPLKLGAENPLLIDPSQPTLLFSALDQLYNQAVDKNLTSEEARNRLVDMEKTRTGAIKARQETKFQKSVGETLETEKSFCRIISHFATHYRQNETQIKDALRKKGYSDLEVAYLFGHFSEAAKASEEMQKGLEEVQTLSLDGGEVEAMDRYARLMEDVYPSYCAVMQRGIFAHSEAVSRNVQGIFFSDVRDVLASYKLVPQEPGHELSFEDFDTLMSVSTQRLPRHKMLYEAAMKEARAKPEEGKVALLESALTLIEANNSAVNKAMVQLGRLTDEGVLPPVSRALTQNLTDKEVAPFKALYAEQAKVIGPIYKGWLVTLVESDPARQRACRAQLRQLVLKSLSQLKKVDQSLTRAGVLEQLKGMENEQVQDFRQSMVDRSHFVYDLLEDLHIQMKYEPHTVDRILGDSILLVQMEAKGVTRKELSQFGRLYDRYMKEFEPLFLAKGALDDDPDNFQLQETLARTYKKQLPKLNRIAEQMKMSQIKKLSDAVKAIPEADPEVLAILPAKQRELIERRQAALKGIPDYSAHLKEMEVLVGEVQRDVHLGMTGDRNFIQKLLIRAKFIKDSAWKRTLSLSGVDEKDLRDLNRFHDTLTELVGPIQEVARQVEAEPGNAKARRELKRLGESQARKLGDWMNRFVLWGGLDKVTQCQQAIDGYLKQLRSRREQLQVAIDLSHTKEGIVLLGKEMFSRNELDEAIAQLERARVAFAIGTRIDFLGDLGGRLERSEI
ncbi:MAG: hypothetical protein KR126chlam2_01170 [Chlamydiae bacterium]|nr:hypothetical protein [Chlamydiota bacterium]